jgi:hypothetical protein
MRFLLPAAFALALFVGSYGVSPAHTTTVCNQQTHICTTTYPNGAQEKTYRDPSSGITTTLYPSGASLTTYHPPANNPALPAGKSAQSKHHHKGKVQPSSP